MWSSILSIFGGAFKIIGEWCSGYNSKKNVEARRIENENKLKDSLNKSLENQNLDDIRRKLP